MMAVAATCRGSPVIVSCESGRITAIQRFTVRLKSSELLRQRPPNPCYQMHESRQ